MSRSKRLVGAANATPVVQFLAPALSTTAPLVHVLFLYDPAAQKQKTTVISRWQAFFAWLSCWLRLSRPYQQS